MKRRMSLSSEPEYGSDGEMDDEDDDDIMQDEVRFTLLFFLSLPFFFSGLGGNIIGIVKS